MHIIAHICLQVEQNLFSFMLSPRSLFECAYIGQLFNKNIIAAIHTDGLWSFPIDLDEGLRDCQKYTTAEAIKMIEALSPAVMVQHIVDETRHRYCALFEILSIPFIGSDAQVSANIVDKGTRLNPTILYKFAR